MDFSRALTDVGGFLDGRGARWAVVGGVAMAALGLLRTTLDLDLVVEARVQEELVRFLESSGYRTLHRSAGYSNHLHDDPVRGRLDFVYVDPATADVLFASVRSIEGPSGRRVAVPKPEHLAAMKVQAIKNDPARVFRELHDLRYLIGLPGVDAGEIRAQFVRHGLEERWRELEATL